MADREDLEATRYYERDKITPSDDIVSVAGSAVQAPERIGRYVIQGVLGTGGFGLVYLAYDDLLSRQVAIKVPHRKLVDRLVDAEAYLAEARVLASLDHPHIVPVYDVGSTDQYPCFIVSKYIDGTDLASRLKVARLTMQEAVDLAATVADALHYAHRHGLVHRDVKPANILLDKSGKPFVADFGLALREEQFGTENERLYGTPHYMSPEQARGEGHLVDGRADIFTLGIVLYELLTGTRPFTGRHIRDVMKAIISHEPRPLRQISDQIPRELERIVMQAMSKRAAERYSTAKDLADDLRHYSGRDLVPQSFEPIPSTTHVDPPSGIPASDSRASLSANTSLVVVPKGLQAFDESDCDFFLGLVPGPHDREGLPQSLRFWKGRLEEQSNPLRIGVVYGPSGCGKSSLIRAGLLPKLNASIHTVVVTATEQSTEVRLLDELKPLLTESPTGLVDALQRLRRNPHLGRRLLIVFDQFEQWLHANQVSAESELVQALRQCDGVHVACLFIVRDDFWMSVHRFLLELDVRLAERENCAAVDLFDRRHARRVLHAFGHAYGALPQRTDELSADQSRFLDDVIAELAEEDRVICVRLALFAQMVRNRPWIPETLVSIGGARGVGIRFLEDTFGSASAPIAYRGHQVAIREMLRALLPPAGTDIKACTQTDVELARAAKCDVRSPDFRQLLAILQEETRLLTPVDSPQGAGVPAPGREQRGYQLTHDYLVPSIRAWLTRKQQETWRGRCELRLAERAALWNSHRELKQLPSLWETLQITLGTKSSNWTPAQNLMMRQAQRWHGRRWLVFSMLLICLLIGAVAVNHNNRQILLQRSSDAIVNQLLVAEIGRVIPLLQEMEATRDIWTDRLHRMAEDVNTAPTDRLRAALALVRHDRAQLPDLLQLLLDTNAETVRVGRQWLSTVARPTPAELHQFAQRHEKSPHALLRIAALGAEFATGSDQLWDVLAQPVALTLATDTSIDANAWAELLLPARSRLAPHLAKLFLDEQVSSASKLNTAQLLSRFASTELLCQLIPDANVPQLALLLPPLSRDRDAAVPRLQGLLTERPPLRSPEEQVRHISRQRTAAVGLMLLGREDLVWPILGAASDCSLRTELTLTLRSYGVPLEILLRGEETMQDPIVRQAIWQSMVGTPVELSSQQRAEIVRRIKLRWPAATHQAERAGIAWLVSKCELPAELIADNPAVTPPPNSDWMVNSQGQTLVQMRGPVEFEMGSHDDDPRRDANELLHRRRIDRSFAVSAHEVTAAQFRRFRPEYVPDQQVCPAPDCPAIAVSWFDAAKYCRWLSEQEKVPEEQMCYPPIDEIKPGLVFYSDLLSRTGYRLPTEAEWEYVCRAGVVTPFFFGYDDRHTSQFGWWIGNSRERTWPVGTTRPNLWGIFDTQGNVQEWCQDSMADYVASSQGAPVSSVGAELHSLDGFDRAIRGASYRSTVRTFRSAHRGRYADRINFSTIGFRLARTMRAP